MNFKEKKLIIFDFDGTLINSIPDLIVAINKMLVHYNLLPLNDNKFTEFIGNGAKLLVERALKCAMQEQKVQEAFIKEALEVYFSYYKEAVCDKTYLYPGVLDTLKYLNNKGYNLVICTNKPFAFIEPILDKLSIKHLFADWIGEDSVSNKKPNAEPLFLLANKMNIVIEKCIMVGDSKNDIQAAQNSGMDSIGVSYGYNYNQSIANFSPTIVVDNFADLQKLF